MGSSVPLACALNDDEYFILFIKISMMIMEGMMPILEFCKGKIKKKMFSLGLDNITFTYILISLNERKKKH